MYANSTARRLRPQARSFVHCLREFLTPALYKQAHQQRQGQKRSSRWSTQPLLLVLLLMTWTCGDSQAERFETAGACCVALLPRRRRPGKTVAGFQKALARLPSRVLRTVAAGIRQVLATRLADYWLTQGFIPIGCDGSRLECPRTAELEQRLGTANKAGAAATAPSLYVTALVHLRLGVPWAWRLGLSTASERLHLLQLLPLLPAAALLVADAGFCGFALTQQLVQQRVPFLLRMCANVTLQVDDPDSWSHTDDGLVYFFPPKRQGQAAPLRLRLLRVRSKKGKQDVWLLTNVLDRQRLSLANAAQFYRWRWESEGQFRAYKRHVGQDEVDQPDGASGASGGRGVAAGVATDAGARRAGGVAAGCCGGRPADVQSAEGAIGDPAGVVCSVARASGEIRGAFRSGRARTS